MAMHAWFDLEQRTLRANTGKATAWILEPAGIDFVPAQAVLRVVKA
jgi:hypothetical protein